MSIDLTSLPKPMPEAKKLNLRLWALLLIVFIFIGTIITVVASFFYRIPNALFLSGAFVFPVLIWGGLFLYRFYAYSYRKIYNNEWNLYREQRKEEMINDGQRGLSVLGYSLITEKGTIGNAAALIDNRFLMTSKHHPTCSTVVPHTSLFLNSEIDINNVNGYLTFLFNQWKKELKNKFSTLLAHENIHVRLFMEIGKSVEIDKLQTLWNETIGTIIPHPASFVFEKPSDSNTFIESWLDNEEYYNDLLLIFNLHLFDIPTKNEGEFASWLFLAGENTDISALLEDDSILVKVHRSEQTSSLSQTIDNALLWGNVNNASYDSVWYNGVSSELKINIANYFNQIEFKPKNMLNVEGSIGYAGLCSYWLCLSLAIENAYNSKSNQLIVIGKPQKATVSAVSCSQNNNKSSSDNGII
ncbi:hypothetical protein A9G48_06695 [Gilliamella sp. wkB18]|jgi:hypothetical protein|uniref:hypothetical protein n=1 Tax=Gilliamella sp. wkB18 TaxID=3120260 RepID=UPI0004DD8E85|nr:hypothetical protein [Gilliamella apicola]KFA59878.1 hypothetical protein GAPWKB11_0621 [Gilliamella apicola]OCG63120.1 hypothetical protein A9G48_06695 [Gilliamella apicola]